jgi:F-type H+-transporting ATPase subunit gamma
MSADRGLCGSFNTNLLSAQHAFIKEKERQGIEVEITTVGRKARDFFRRRKANIRRSHEDIRKFTFDIASQIAEDIINAFLSHHVDEVYVIYSRFVNIVSQKPTTQKLLPFRFEDLSGSEIEVDETSKIEYLYEPSPDLLMEAMLPYYIKTQIYHFLLENNASEQAARMTAMDNATNNCKDMINKLTLVFNKVRQASITKELMDIVGGAEALKK